MKIFDFDEVREGDLFVLETFLSEKQFFIVCDIRNGVPYSNGISLSNSSHFHVGKSWNVSRRATPEERQEFFALLKKYGLAINSKFIINFGF